MGVEEEQAIPLAWQTPQLVSPHHQGGEGADLQDRRGPKDRVESPMTSVLSIIGPARITLTAGWLCSVIGNEKLRGILLDARDTSTSVEELRGRPPASPRGSLKPVLLVGPASHNGQQNHGDVGLNVSVPCPASRSCSSYRKDISTVKAVMLRVMFESIAVICGSCIFPMPARILSVRMYSTSICGASFGLSIDQSVEKMVEAGTQRANAGSEGLAWIIWRQSPPQGNEIPETLYRIIIDSYILQCTQVHASIQFRRRQLLSVRPLDNHLTSFLIRAVPPQPAIMSPDTLSTISPTTNSVIVTRQALSPEHIVGLPSTGQQAFTQYRRSHPTLASRQEVVAKALKLLSERKDVLSKELTEQMGRPIAYTGVEIDTAVKRGEYLNRIAGEVLEVEVPGDSEKGFRRFIRREPVGVVLIIFAWNVSPPHITLSPLLFLITLQYPYLILINSLLPALLAGNSVILKPSPQTPTIVEHMSEIFTEAGLPEGVLQYFHCGSPSHIDLIVRSSEVNHICFTGSVAGGLAVQKAAADRIINVGLELGGKDPAYVRPDVDPKWAASEIIDGAIFNSGQSCCAIERVYVHCDIYDSFIAACKEILAEYKVGDPMDKSTQIGPVISQRAKETILSHISDAIAAGAKDETPANSSFDNLPQQGNFIKPTLLTNVNHTMSIMRDETFGPVIPVMSVPSSAAAIEYMNDSQFGLTASIWSKSLEKAEYMANQIEAGTVFINRADYPSPDLAWTGWKDSGKGVTLSRFGFEQFVKLRSFHFKEYPGE